MWLKMSEPLTPFNSCTGFGLKGLKDCHVKALFLYPKGVAEDRRKEF